MKRLINRILNLSPLAQWGAAYLIVLAVVPRLVGLDVVPNDVAHQLAVEREELVTGEQPRVVSRRSGHDRQHAGGHRPSVWGARSRDWPAARRSA